MLFGKLSTSRAFVGDARDQPLLHSLLTIPMVLMVVELLLSEVKSCHHASVNGRQREERWLSELVVNVLVTRWIFILMGWMFILMVQMWVFDEPNDGLDGLSCMLVKLVFDMIV